jgi:F0F1-type ATP synthase membrane subunit b/b'
VNENIEAIARVLAEEFGARAMDVATRQFDHAEGEAKQAWGRIMEALILQIEATRDPA